MSQLVSPKDMPMLTNINYKSFRYSGACVSCTCVCLNAYLLPWSWLTGSLGDAHQWDTLQWPGGFTGGLAGGGEKWGTVLDVYTPCRPGNNDSKPKFTRNIEIPFQTNNLMVRLMPTDVSGHQARPLEAGGGSFDQFHDGLMQLTGRLTSVYRPRRACLSMTAETNKPLIPTLLSLLLLCVGLLKLNSQSKGSLLVVACKED